MSEDDLFKQFMSQDRKRITSTPEEAQGRVNTRLGVSAQPDQQAQFGDLAKRYGVPAAVVENDPTPWQQRAASDGAQQHIDDVPKLGAWLGQDPQRAKVSHDSLEAMAGVAKAFGFGLMQDVANKIPVARVTNPATGKDWSTLSDADKLRSWHLNNPGQGSLVAAPSTTQVILSKLWNTARAAAANGNDIAGGFWGTLAAATKIVGDNPVSRFAQQGAEINAQLAEQRTTPQGGTLEQGFYSAVRSLPLSVGSIIAGGPSGSLVQALAPIGVSQFGQSFAHAQTEGLGYGRSLVFGAVDAAVETGTEALPLGHMLQALKVGTPMTKRVIEFAIAQAEEQGGEQIATHVEDFNQWAQIDSNKGKSFADYLAERPNAALQTAVSTAFTSGIMGAAVTAHHAIASAAGGMQRKEQQATVAKHTEALLTGLKDLAEAAPVAKRDVSTFENWVKAAADGTKATDVYIDAHTLVQTLQQSGLTEPEILAALPSIQTELPTALASNGDVRIPIEEFTARSGELGASLIPHLRLDPNDMSTSEAQTFMQSAQEEFQKETDKAFDQISADDQFRQSAENVKESIAQQLDTAGRFNTDTNSAYASLYSSFFARLAADLGETPEAVAARYPLQIQAEGVGQGAGVLDQNRAQTETPEFKNWFGGSKVVDEKGAPLVVYHGTSKDFEAFDPETIGTKTDAGWAGHGFYFSSDPSVADAYGGKTVAAFVSVKNPYEFKGNFAKEVADKGGPKAFSEWLRANGYDGAKLWSQVMVLDPTQIKSVNNRGTFDPNDPRILYQNGKPIFYSVLQRTVENSKQTKAPASQWKAILQNAPGVKAEELEWSGVLDLLDADPKATVTRDQLAALLEGGGIQIEEVELGGDRPTDEQIDSETERRLNEEMDALEDEEGDTFSRADYESDNWGRVYDEVERGYGQRGAAARFRDWSSDPSNDSYRELLITLPIGSGNNPDRAPSTHWDQPAVVAHARFMEKRDASGDRVLFIEEVQSDWHQKGRDQGYKTAPDPDVIDAARKKWLAAVAEEEAVRDEVIPQLQQAHRTKRAEVKDYTDRSGQPELLQAFDDSSREPQSDWATSAIIRYPGFRLIETQSLVDKLSAAHRAAVLADREYQIAINGGQGIPDAPFKSTWPALVMKRMIRYAVDNGYTKVAWTTGEQQADRYNLSQATGAITARQDEETGKYWVSFEQGSAGEILSEQGMAENFEGRAVMTPEQMQTAFGKDIAQRIVDGAVEGKYAKLHDADLKVGGEGMKAFYDRNLVNITNDLVKKHGTKVGKIAFTDKANPLAQQTQPIPTDENHGFEITPKMAEAAAGGFPLFQRKGAARGQASFAEDITATPSVITLLRGADLSTFLHESGHFFLEVLMHVAAQPDAPQRVVDDMNAFLKWTGVESMGQWSKMTTNEKRDHHERFARGFEAYLYEGRAPSLELKSLFNRFRSWLLTVYRSLKELNVEITPEVRGVFDRMLASDAQIKEAEQQVGYEPILTEKPEGMDDGEWEAYQRLGQEATTEAVADLERRSLRDMRYVGKAAGRELKRLQREIKSMRDTMRAEVKADLANEPVYRAQEFMKKGLLNGGAVEGPTKMLLSEVEALYEDRPVLYVNEVKRALGFGQYGMLAKEGIHPEQVAELFGFTSADHMIQDLMLAEPFKKAVETEIDTRMLERYGDITSEKALQDAVDQAIHNDVRGRFVATEFAALSKAPGKPRVLAAAAKQLAEGAVARLKVRNLRPAQYEAAERRAAKAAAEAARKGEVASAAAEKRNQLINFYGAKASRDALTEVDRIVRYFKKFDTAGTRKNLDIGYLDQIDKLLERFDLRKSVTNRQADKRKSLSAWVERQKEQGFDPLIDEELLDEANRTPYRELTVEEIRGLRDAVKNIEHLARLKKKLLTAKDKREFADAVDDVASTIRANAYKSVAEIIGAKSWWEGVQSGVADFFAMHRKMANWAHVMDGNKTGGAVWERFIRPMNEAGNKEAGRRAQATKDLGALFDRLKGQNLNKRTFIPAIGKSLSLQDRLMVALNLGNEGNTQRVMDGERWEQDKLNAVLEPLGAEHWAFVQAVWDYLDSFYPEIAAKEIRVTGVAPEKVAARPFERQLADGQTVTLRGGYFPIKYDTARSSRAEADTAAEVLQQMTQGKYTAAQTRRGHTKARAEQVDRPVRKDFGVIFEHVNQVIHDLSWHEYLIDANRLLRAVDIDSAIREAHGPQVLKWMRKALEDIAIGDIPAQNSFESAINHVRAGASIAALGWNLWTSLLQPIGLTQSASRIGSRWVAIGAGRVIGDAAHMENTAKWVYSRSEFMRLRGLTQQREIAEIRNKLSDKSPLRKTVELAVPAGVVDAVEGSYFALIAKAQMIADLPTWIGQYEKSMAAGETEERAADLADQAVLDSQGGGQTKDLAGIQRGSPLMKLWTNFYSYFNTTYNLMADRTTQLRRVGPSDLPSFAVDQLMLTAVPSILTTVLYQLIKGDGDDWDKLSSKIGADLFSYLTGLMVGLREIGAVLNPESSYQGPAGARVFSEINKFGKQVQQGEVDEALVRSANQLGGILFHYPAGQVDRTARGLQVMSQGEAGPMAPVVGPPPKQ